MKIIFILLLAVVCSTTHAQKHSAMSTAGKLFFHESTDGHYELRNVFRVRKQGSENPRLVAIALDISLGLLGMHRLYLGTDLKIPIAYTLTFGGGGVLWLVDLGLLIFSKDISAYYDNPHMFMWVNQ